MPRSPERLRIVFLLQELSQNGGVLEVCQIVNRLVLEGHDALIATVDPRRASEELGLLSEPLRYPDADALVRRFPGADVVVATLWTTASWLADLRRRGHSAEGVYYCQDFEPLFYPEGSAHHRAALASYDLVPRRIATTDWLAGLLRERGWSSHVIPLGVNRGIFHPRPGREPGREFVVTAAARPRGTERRRGFAGLLECCRLLHRIDPTIRFDLFGCAPAELPRDPGFPVRPVGLIASPDAMARHLASCDLLLDPSLYQAFGRPGLEAMAVGTPAVLPDAGGIGAYAVHEENCLLYTAGDPETMAAAVLELRRDARLRRRLARGGLETARRFDHREEGLRHLEFYRSLLAGRVEAPRPLPEPAMACVS
jgi:glycosyltransferase involved in cell wall biosynthesis